LNFNKINEAVKKIVKDYEDKSYYNVDVTYDTEERDANSVDLILQ